MADSDDRGGLEALAVALQSTFRARDDASLALALLGLLSDGRAVTATTLTQTANLAEVDVVARLSSWPHIERDEAGDIVAFAGLTLRPTPHHFNIGNRKLHAWCAWDTLFLPTLLNATAVVAPAARSPTARSSSSSRRTASRARGPRICTCRFRRWRRPTRRTSPGRFAATCSFSLAPAPRAPGARHTRRAWSWTSGGV